MAPGTSSTTRPAATLPLGGTLTATWDSGDTCTVTASKVLSSTQHFFCTASGALTGVSTNLPGKLVLSDFSCETKEPPKCDPKTQVCK